MSEQDYLRQQIKESSCIRLAVLFGCFFVCLIISTLIGGLIDSAPLGSLRDKHLWMSVVQNILAFCLPAFLLARFCSKRPFDWLGLKKPISLKQIAGVIIVYILTMPAMEWLIEWNQHIHFPDSLSNVEQIMRNWENSSNAISENLLNSNSAWGIISGVLVIGILTGFSEELFFRGGLQGLLSSSALNKISCIWISAIVFSTMHFQFFGFFPRLLMGAFFGYLLYWTGSLWPAIFAHILNNGLIVIIAGLLGQDSIYPSIAEEEIAEIILPIGSLILSILFFVFFREFFFNSENHKSIWQKNQVPPITRK